MTQPPAPAPQRATLPTPSTAPALPATAGARTAATTGAPAAPERVVDTPALLNRWQVIGTTVAVVFGLLAALVQFLGWQADGRAAADTEQLIRVQEIQSSLLQADALATTSFLAAGVVDDTDGQTQYDAALADVLESIVDAADAQPADREALGVLNEQVEEYASDVAVARAYNRQGYPIGAQYLSGASEQLRTEAVPVLSNLVEANTERAEDAMGGQHPWWLLAIGLLALAGLLWLNHLLARTFRRRINRGLAVAAGIVLVTTLVATVAAGLGAGQNEGLRDDELARATDQADARTAANAAKAFESLRLIERGSGAKYEDQWTAAAAVVEERSDPDLLGSWTTYTERHAEIVRLDDADAWVRAVRIAIDPGEAGSTAPLEAFDTDSAAAVDDLATQVTESLRSGRTLALIGSALTLLLGVAAAIAVTRGFNERRKEYA